MSWWATLVAMPLRSKSVVAVADGARLQAGQVAARTGFTEELTPDVLAGDDLREQVVFLFLRAVDHDRRAGPAVADAAAARCAPPGELLTEDELLLHAQA